MPFSGDLPLTIAPAVITAPAWYFTKQRRYVQHQEMMTVSDATYLWSTDEGTVTFGDDTSELLTMTADAVLGTYTLRCVVTSATADDSPLTLEETYEVVILLDNTTPKGMNFSELNKDNFILFAIKNYENPRSSTQEDFEEDLSRFKYVKRWLRKYHETGTCNSHLC